MSSGMEKICPAIIGTKHEVVQYMHQQRTCPACSSAMEIQKRSDIQDGFRWRCTRCKKSRSLTTLYRSKQSSTSGRLHGILHNNCYGSAQATVVKS